MTMGIIYYISCYTYFIGKWLNSSMLDLGTIKIKHAIYMYKSDFVSVSSKVCVFEEGYKKVEDIGMKYEGYLLLNFLFDMPECKFS